MLLSNLNLLATAPGGVARLRELIFKIAAVGRLLPEVESIAPTFLDSVADFVMGQAPPGSECNMNGVGTVFVKTGEFGKLFPEVREWTTKPLKFAQRGDVLICVVGATIGKLNLAIDCAIGRSVAAIRPREGLKTEYLYYALMPFTLALRENSRGSAQGVIGKSELAKVSIRVPSIEEQTRIVTRVEELMRLCDALEVKGQLEATQHAQLVSTLLATLTDSKTPEQLADNWHRIATHFDLLLDRPEAVDALEQTILQLAVRGLLVPQDPLDEPASELLQKIRSEKDKLIAEGKIKRDKPLPPIAEDEQPFDLPKGWEWKRLADVVLKITDGEHLSPPKAREGMPLLTAKDVTNEGVNLEATQFVSEENGLRYRQRCDPGRGDVLICSRGTIGRCAAIETDQIFCLMGSVILLKCADQLSYKYLLLHLRTELAQAWMRGVSSATAVSALYLKDVARCLIPVPPFSEQSRIVARVAELRRLCDDLRQRLSASQSTQAHLAEALVQEVA